MAGLAAAALDARGLFLLGIGASLALFTVEGFRSIGLNRVGVALLVAPIAPCIVVAVVGWGEWSTPLVLPYMYWAGLSGIPAYFVFRALGWLSPWQVMLGGFCLGAAVAALLLNHPPLDHLLRSAALGAIAAAVFWILAFAGKPSPRGA